MSFYRGYSSDCELYKTYEGWPFLFQMSLWRLRSNGIHAKFPKPDGMIGTDHSRGYILGDIELIQFTQRPLFSLGA